MGGHDPVTETDESALVTRDRVLVLSYRSGLNCAC
jgi:hypothetical protein